MPLRSISNTQKNDSLCGCSGGNNRRFAKIFAQPHPLVARLFLQLRHVRFAHRFAFAGEFGVEGAGNRAHAGLAHQRQQAQNFGFDPTRLGVVFGAALVLWLSASAAQARPLANRLGESTPVVMQQQHQNRQQNHQVESGAEVDLHVVALKHKSAASIESRRSRSDFSLDAQARAGEIRTPEQNPGQKQNVTIEMECVVKSERIWLWARLMTLRSPVGPRLSKITNELDGGFRAINYEFSFSFMLGRNGCRAPF